MKNPQIDKNAWIAAGAVVLGDVTLSKNCSVWYNATIRGDRGAITVGEGSNIQDNAVLHTSKNHQVQIGRGVSIGHGAIVHGAAVGDNTVIGMGATVLNGAKIGKNCIIGAAALITQNKVIPDNSLVIGHPGKVIRSVTAEEIQANEENAKTYVKEAEEYKNR